LPHADGVGVHGHHHGGDGDIVVDAFVPLLDSLRLEPLRHYAGVVEVVVFRDEVDGGLAAGPPRGEVDGDFFHAGLGAAAVAGPDDLTGAVSLKAAGDIGGQPLEGLLGAADGAGILQVAGGRVDVPLGNEGDDRRHQRVAKLAGDRLGRGAEHVVVLAGREIRPVLLDTAG